MPLQRLVLLSLAASFAVAAGCSGGSGSSAAAGARTAALTFTAAADDGNAAVPTDPLVIRLASGQLELTTARFHVGDLELELHRRRRGRPDPTPAVSLRHDGDNDDDQGEGNDGDGNDGNGSVDDATELDEVSLRGPFAFDLAAGPAVLDQVSVFPGTFDRVDLHYVLAAESPFDGASIVVEGTFVTDQGSTPFTLRSAFVGKSRVAIAGGSITVTENSVVPVELAFDLQAMLGGLDVASAVVDGGEILIDGTTNSSLLAAFEAGIGARGCVGAHERHR